MMARLETTQIEPRLEPMRQRVLWLLREQHPLNNSPAVVASTSLQRLWSWAADDDHWVLLISWATLALVSWVMGGLGLFWLAALTAHNLAPCHPMPLHAAPCSPHAADPHGLPGAHCP